MHGNHQNWKGNKGVPRGAPRATHGGCLATPASTALFLPFVPPLLPYSIPLFTSASSSLPAPPNLDRPSRGIHPSSPDPSSVFLHPRFLPPLPAFPVSPNTNALPLSTLSSTTTIVHPFLFFSFSLFFPPLFLLLPDLFPIRRSILLFPPSPPPPFPRCPTIFPSSSPTPSFSFLHGFPHCLFAPRQNREHGYTLFPLPSALSLSLCSSTVRPTSSTRGIPLCSRARN